MPANLENSAVVTGLEKVSFYSNPKEGQIPKKGKCQKREMPKKANAAQLHSSHTLVT